MGAKARGFLQSAIDSYLVHDGATDLGAYRDAITDLLHMAYELKLVRTTNTDHLYDLYLYFQRTTRSAEEMFEEELANIENELVHSIPDSDLPLHSVDEFNYSVNKSAFEHRLKNKGAAHDTEAQVCNVRKKKKHT